MLDVAVICGPTAAGKSAVAMALAQRTGALVVSADSRQVYRRFDIGTAKPTVVDRAAVPHLGLDVVEPTTRYSAAAWWTSARDWLHDACCAARPVIVVGGTGLYLRTLETPLFESPALDPDARADVLAALEPQSTDALRAQCATVDPARAHLGRTQLLRALEVFALTGRPLSAWQVERARPREFRPHYLLVDPGAVLRDRIATRVQQMLGAGWDAEVASLMRDVPPDAPAWNACGYALLRSAALGEVTHAQAVERTIIDTRQYAKRQRTWFRHQLPADRTRTLDPTAAAAHDAALAWFEAITLTEHT